MRGARREGGVEVKRGVVGVRCLRGGFGHLGLFDIETAVTVCLRVCPGLWRDCWTVLVVDVE